MAATIRSMDNMERHIMMWLGLLIAVISTAAACSTSESPISTTTDVASVANREVAFPGEGIELEGTL